MRSQVRRAFPDRDFVPVTLDHQVFRVNYFLDDLEGMAEFVPGGRITYLAKLNDRGEIAILAGHNNDLANFWAAGITNRTCRSNQQQMHSGSVPMRSFTQ